MSKSMLVGVLLGGTALAGAGMVATYHRWGGPFAEVVNVTPVTTTIRIPRQDCHEEQVTHQKPVQDEHRVAGTVVGALIGGVLGNQVGRGNGQKLATLAGATGGGYAGNQIQDKMQKADTYTTTEQRCETVYDSAEKQAGFTVTYRLNGKTPVIHMDHDPGSRIPVRDGKLVLNSSTGHANS